MSGIFEMQKAYSSHHPKRLLGRFLCGSQMLCCTVHCQRGRKPPKLPLPLGISSPCLKRTEPRPQATRTEKW